MEIAVSPCEEAVSGREAGASVLRFGQIECERAHLQDVNPAACW